MNHTRYSFVDDVHRQDFETVYSTLGSVSDAQMRQGIYTGTAQADDVYEWFCAQDPLFEAREILRHSNPDPEQIKEELQIVIDKATTQEIAAGFLMATVATPELFREEQSKHDWIVHYSKIFDEYVAEHNIEVLHPETEVMSVDDTIIIALELLKDKQLTSDDMKRFTTAAELLRRAYVTEYQLAAHPDAEKLFGYDDNHLTIAESARLNLGMCVAIRERLVDEVFACDEPIAADTRTKLALEAQWKNAEAVFSLHRVMNSGLKDPDALREIEAMIRNLGAAFLGTDALTDSGKRGEWKGSLHEMMWMLDGYLIIMSDEKYKGIGLHWADEANDAPRVGRPKLRRGYDYIVATEATGRAFIQLKSSTKQRAEYHSGIKVIHEDNFIDTNPRRLSAKLINYRRMLATDQSEWSSVLDKYALNSVRTELDLHADKLQAHNNAKRVAAIMSGRALSGARVSRPMNRAERRKKAKENRG